MILFMNCLMNLELRSPCSSVEIERLTTDQEVGGSNPLRGSKSKGDIMSDFSTLMIGNSFAMTILNHIVLTLAIMGIGTTLIHLVLPPQLAILWTGSTKMNLSKKRTVSIDIPNKIIVTVYLIVCLLAIIFFP